jgi:hypothetical protein
VVVDVSLVDRVGLVGIVGVVGTGSAECVGLIWFDLRCGAMVRF